ncbi:DNA-binding protein [Streptomyces sp. NPDC102441]|uniref:DNA-binding protein n=1 Tax=Streptomyces sp. NPDC102441 TaxID=3366176 RepID=UPI0037F1D914
MGSRRVRVRRRGAPKCRCRHGGSPEVVRPRARPLRLRTWRRKRTGPRGFRVGRHLRFDPDDVRVWVDSRRSEAAA